MVVTTGFIVANAIASTWNVMRERTGPISIFISATSYGTGVIGSGLVGMFANGITLPMTIITSVLCLFCLLFSFLVPTQSRTEMYNPHGSAVA